MNGLIRRDEVTLGEMGLGYFLGPVFAQLSNAVFAAYLNRYYSDVIEWTDAAKYGMFSTLLPVISVLFIVIGNLYAGRRIDEIRTPQGKARPFLVLSAPIVPTAIMLLFFMPRSWPPFARMFWIAFTYNFYFAFAWPVYFTAHSALCGLSTRNAKEKGRLAALTEGGEDPGRLWESRRIRGVRKYQPADALLADALALEVKKIFVVAAENTC